MFVTIVYVKVKTEFVTNFIEACEINHKASIKEQGNRRFDVLQSPANRNEFILYEAYQDETSAAAHKQTEHYARWRDTVADWMAQARQGVRYDGLFPQ